MNKKIKVVDNLILDTAKKIVNSQATVGKTNEIVEREIRDYQLMLKTLCELYHIAHTTVE